MELADNHFVRIDEQGALDELAARSDKSPIVIFKHSTSCGISTMAYAQMARVAAEVVLVEVQNARELSREIEVRTGVAHETPQVIVLRNGKAVWHGSHSQIKTEVVEQAVRENA